MIRSTAIRQPKRKKKRKESLASLKRKAWKLFSEMIRRGAADYRGMVQCVSCPHWLPWKEAHAGHFYPKARGLAYYFYERNVHPQCPRCNLFGVEQAKINYTVFMWAKYGDGIIDELSSLENVPVKYSRQDYLEMIENYKTRLRVIEKSEKWNVPHDGTSEVA